MAEPLQVGQLVALLLGVWLLAACAGHVEPGAPPQPDREQDAPPDVIPPGLETLPDPEPRWEPLSRSGNRSPYMVFGQTYHLLPTAEGYAETGIASWYGRKFHGRPTASGEPYDMFELTAAHRKLPLPTYVRVTNLDNQRSAIVKVNDRGPFHDQRIIDLSYGAAVRLGFADQGTTRVKVEAITPADEPLPNLDTVEVAPALNTADGTLWLQAGAFGNPEAAEALRDRLDAVIGERMGSVRVHLSRGADALTRVRVGPLPDLREAARLQALITSADLGGVPLLVLE